MNGKIIIAGITLAITPHLVHAQVGGSAGIETEARVEARADHHNSAARSSTKADANVRLAAQAGLPTAPVERAVAEGKAKGATDAQIARAAAQVTARLSAARESLSGPAWPEPTQDEISAGADALAAGAATVHLRTLRQNADDGRSLVASIQALTSLATAGMDPATASAAIAARLAAGAPDRAIASLGAQGSLAPTATGAAAAGSLGASTGVAIGSVGGVAGTIGAGASIVGGLGGR